MIKKLDILIIRSFIGPFIVTFFVTLFIFVMQFFWLYMDELLGKGLGPWLIIQLLVLMSATLVPFALPLCILLASIMTFGNMGENFELVAIKSAGISLVRFIRPLFVFILFISGIAFIFNNNVIPFANLKALSLLYDLRHSKPTFNIKEGQFNKDIDRYSIRVGEKDNDGKTIRNIIIYDHTSGNGNDKVTVAEEGEMIPAANKQFMIFRLKDGWRYEESINRNSSQNKEQIRMYFKKWDKVFDLSSFKINRTNEDLFKNAYQMMNVSQLKEGIDSFKRYEAGIPEKLKIYLGPYITMLLRGDDRDTLIKRVALLDASTRQYDSTFLETIPMQYRHKVLQLVASNVRNSQSMVRVTNSDKILKGGNFMNFLVEWHKKFILSFACIVLFLIGAPLGAIIRKGGIGMPLVIAIVFFVIYHILSVTGEKMAKTGSVPTWMGMWMATAVLLPIAFLLIYQARNDANVLSKDWYLKVLKAFKSIVPSKKQ
ncbi:MAG: LptF/LptG family permease [Flavipsychrobacter sp.]